MILLFLLLTVPLFAEPPARPVQESGVLHGAAYYVEKPAGWNGSLVVFAHGYAEQGGFNPHNRKRIAQRSMFLSRGYAWAESAYSGDGWAVQEGIADTEALRRYFEEKHGKPARTLVIGESMGGLIAVAIVEQYPEHYDGAMPMCAFLEASTSGLKERVFDLLVLFDYLFPDKNGGSLLAGPKREPREIRSALASRPDAAAALARHLHVRDSDLPAIIVFAQDVFLDLTKRAGGNPFDNHDTRYTGFPNEEALNAGIRRHKADPAAAQYLQKYYTPTGRIADPVLEIHNIYDPVVVSTNATFYGELTARTGNEDRFFAMVSQSEGHCRFRPEEIANAFDMLAQWVNTGRRPE